MNRSTRTVLQELSRASARNLSTARPSKPLPTSNKPPTSTILRDFPWRTVARDPKSSEIIQERTIYARPLNFRPKLLWVVMLAMVPGCFLAADTVQVKLEFDKKIAAEQAAAEAASPSSTTSTSSETVKPSPFDPLWDVVSPESILSGALLSLGGTLTVLIMYYPTRVVRRLSQMRRVPSSTLSTQVAGKLPASIPARLDVPKGEELGESWIRLDTAAEGMWRGRWGLPRDIQMSRVRPGLIRAGTTSSPYLRLTVDPLSSTWFSLDKQSYRLDFRRVEDRDFKSKEDEVVVSWKRLEQVFGELK